MKKRKEYQTGGRLENSITLTDVWDDIPSLPHNSSEKLQHPTQKPKRLSERLLRLFGRQNLGNSLFVPFAGTGSEIKVAHELGYSFILGVEKNVSYYDQFLVPLIT